MKNLFTISVLALFLVSCSTTVTNYSELQDRNGIFFLINDQEPFTGRVVHKEDGIKVFEGVFKDGIRTDEWVYYYPNGQIRTTGVYEDGLKHGQWPVWQENGVIEYYEVFRYGTLIAGGINEDDAEKDDEKEKEEMAEKETKAKEKKDEMQWVDWAQLRGGSRKTLNGVPYTGGVIKYFRNTRDRELVGYFNNGYRSGKWTFYHRNGNVRDVRYY